MTVSAISTRAFTAHLSTGEPFTIVAGEQSVPVELLSNWYARKNGLREASPAKPAVKASVKAPVKVAKPPMRK
jgi:hypothetical protein